jgi:hypothetical protein
MRVLGIDPSLVYTGIGCVCNRGDTLVEGALIRVEGADHGAKTWDLWKDLGENLDRLKPDIIVVETPATKGRTREHWGYEKQSKLTPPVYGMAVGVAMGASYAYQARQFNREISVLNRAADVWTQRMPSTKNDQEKTGRVLLVEQIFGLAPGSLGARTVAGNVADAILLARHMAAMLDVEDKIKGATA